MVGVDSVVVVLILLMLLFTVVVAVALSVALSVFIAAVLPLVFCCSLLAVCLFVVYDSPTTKRTRTG